MDAEKSRILRQRAMAGDLPRVDDDILRAGMWKDVYPPPHLIAEIQIAIQATQSRSVHYFGLCDETLLRGLAAIPDLRISATNMYDDWLRTPMPPYGLPVALYDEGAPRVHAWIQDMVHPMLIRLAAQKQEVIRLVVGIGLAIPDVLWALEKFQWTQFDGFVVGVRNDLR